MYWPPRLLALSRSLRTRGDKLDVIEIAGSGSPYDVVSPDRTERELNPSVLFPKGDLRRMPGRVMAKAVERKLDELEPDIVLAGAIAFPSGAAAVRWSRRNRRRVIIFDDARSEDVPRSRLVELVKRHIYANVDAILIPAESHVSSYVHWGISRERMYFGLNVVDNHFFSSRADALRPHACEFRRDKGLPERFFLGVGRHVEKKNWTMCLEAYRRYRLRSRESWWGLVLVGDGPERIRLEERIRGQSIPDVYLPGAVAGDDLVSHYVAAGALVLPSLHGETWGLVVNEAMACGLPVLVSNQCGCVETLVQDGVNGWRFSPADPDELTAKMLQMSGLSDEEHSRMARASEDIIGSWGLERFVEGATTAIDACKQVNRGFVSLFDRLLVSAWNGRFRPT
jgi:glycosyltransferase involved in cell wall biosynthesis